MTFSTKLRSSQAILAALLLLAGPVSLAPAAAVPRISALRVPDGGIQPQVVVDRRGVVHLLYYKGDPGHGDIFYVRSADGGWTFSAPLRVNSQPGSAIAVGSIRGAQIAVGRNGRVHVAWNGSDLARPRLAQDPTVPVSKYNSPMLYTRLKDDGSGFEPQRNLMRASYALDGGGSVAADDLGNVYVAWHGEPKDGSDETHRRVWLVHSSDEGKTFSREAPAWNEPSGACGCCGLKIFADPMGAVYLLYRAAIGGVERDMYLLASRGPTDASPSQRDVKTGAGRAGIRFEGTRVARWHINACPMSSESFSRARNGVIGAWETKGQVYFTRIDPKTLRPGAAIAAPGAGEDRKHPSIAANNRGEVLLAWTEGMGWGTGGAVAWQVFDDQGRLIPGAAGRTEGVPAWSLVAAFARPDGSFVILY